MKKSEAETATVYYTCIRMIVTVKGKLPILLLMVISTEDIGIPMPKIKTN